MLRKRTQPGFTLVEVLVSIAISVLVFGGLLSSFEYTLKLIAHSRAKTSATSIANDRLEYIRSLSYDDVGTVSGIPAGLIPQNSTSSFNGFLFDERVLIEYVDDPADGMLTATTTDSNGIPADYKRVKIEISWTLREETKSMTLVSNIVPRSIETTDGGGTIRINVIDENAAPLPGIDVTIINNTTTSTINITKATDVSGSALFSGAPVASNYEVIVGEAGYSFDQTHEATTTNPNPVTAPFSVLEADISTLTFQVDRVSDIDVTVYSSITEASDVEYFDDMMGVASSSNVTVTSGNLLLENTAGVYDSSGMAYLQTITPATIEHWESVTLAPTVPVNTSLRVHFYTESGGIYTLIPDSDLPNNSSGFTERVISLQNLDASVYTNIVPVLSLSTTNTSVTPEVSELVVYYRESSVPRSGDSITLTGAKVIGYQSDMSPIYKTILTDTTSGAGNISFSDVEFDTYTYTLPADRRIATACSESPLKHHAGVPSTAEIVHVSGSAHSLRVSVTDSTGTFIPGVDVTLSRTGFSDTSSTNTCGQVYFGSVTSASDYVIDVSKPGFNSASINPYDLSGESTTVIMLNES
ncbi:MAG: carboxypeptidase regulatory-like domain-containing protein [Candidatus Pacebacteria bacterium]|nr:carboxypeptidase regulatory-like domain-containing protein [Candidatus Paceibacterota bacterium]MBP9843160.1 carboxypeptidase regulatory-like domain-containing protein [Candidatus Paceibacterota bacterium]